MADHLVPVGIKLLEIEVGMGIGKNGITQGELQYHPPEYPAYSGNAAWGIP